MRNFSRSDTDGDAAIGRVLLLALRSNALRSMGFVFALWGFVVTR